VHEFLLRRKAFKVMTLTDITLILDVSHCQQISLEAMARWEPGAAKRLQVAALDLFASQGFDRTTAAEIAHAAGLTERTFFRYFRDKRDVLFYGQDLFVAAFLTGLGSASQTASPMELISSGLTSVAANFPNEHRPYARLRQTVIESNPALLERERHKLAGFALTIADALRARGLADPAATLAAESAATVFKVAFAQWIHEDQQRSLGAIAASVLDGLIALSRPPAAEQPAGTDQSSSRERQLASRAARPRP
jgi:AcrR family transcriptional regulator